MRRKSEAVDKRKQSMVGKKFGRLTVLGPDPNNRYKVVCKCDCGRTTSVQYNALIRDKARVVSCGCYRHSKEFGAKTSAHLADYYKNNFMFGTNFAKITNTTPRVDNKTGCTGVCPNSQRGGYDSYLFLQGKRVYHEHFDNLEDAIKARKEAEERFFTPMIARINAAMQ